LALKNKVTSEFPDVCVEDLPPGLPSERDGDYPIKPLWDEKEKPP
jgi:hypothetical protein